MTGRRWSAGLFEKPATPKGAQGKGKKPIKTKDIELADVRKDAVKAAKNPKVQKAANVTACVIASIMAGLCLATGIGIAAVASAATTLAVEPPPVDAPHCATVDPETTAAAKGYGTATGVDATAELAPPEESDEDALTPELRAPSGALERAYARYKNKPGRGLAM